VEPEVGGQRKGGRRRGPFGFAFLMRGGRINQTLQKENPKPTRTGRKWPDGHRVRKCCTCQSLRGRLLGFGRGGRQLVVTGASSQFTTPIECVSCRYWMPGGVVFCLGQSYAPCGDSDSLLGCWCFETLPRVNRAVAERSPVDFALGRRKT
jgi:hypothetical protein